MATKCTATFSDISKGDAVCIVGYDTVNFPLAPILVARASAANLATSKTVFGIAEDDGVEDDDVFIRTAGEFADDSITSLGNVGGSRIVATDITATHVDPATEAALQCRLIRVDRPDGSEHVVGTCDENGHLSVQPRASLETSARHMINVVAFGAIADGKVLHDAAIDVGIDGTILTASATTFAPEDNDKQIRVSGADAGGAPFVTQVIAVGGGGTQLTLDDAASTTVDDALAILWMTDNAAAINAAIGTIPVTGGTLFFPGPGVYVVADDVDIPSYVEVVFGDAAILVAAGATVTIEGRVTAHPLRQIFGGAGRVEAVDGPTGLITVSGDPHSDYAIVVTITTGGGLGTAEFTYSVNGNPDLDYLSGMTHPPKTQLATANFVVPGTGLTLIAVSSSCRDEKTGRET